VPERLGTTKIEENQRLGRHLSDRVLLFLLLLFFYFFIFYLFRQKQNKKGIVYNDYSITREER